MRTIDEIQRRVQTTFTRQWTTWLGDDRDQWPKAYSLDPPTEAEAHNNWRFFQQWMASWRDRSNCDVRFEPRAWPKLGTQHVPVRIVFDSPDAMLSWVEDSPRQNYTLANSRWMDLAKAWPDLAEVVRRQASVIGTMAKEDLDRLVAVVDWLSSNLDCGLYVRQLPIKGVDTKWIERHAGLVTKLIAARTQRKGDLYEVAGLRGDPTRRRIRLLDEGLRAKIAGISDLSLPLDQLARLDLPVKLVVVVENLQTALAFEDIPGTLLVMGGGFSVIELGQIPWMINLPILYWGDIDTSGLAILNALRNHHPQTASVLMDEETFLTFAPLWTEETHQNRGTLDALTPSELAMRKRLLDHPFMDGQPSSRLEQERIPWDFAWKAVTQKACELGSASVL